MERDKKKAHRLAKLGVGDFATVAATERAPTICCGG